LRILVVTPAPAGSRSGNRGTALRWQRILRALGQRVRIASMWRAGDACDLLVALHATRSAASVAAFRRHRPDAPLVVALTGTDLYLDLASDPRTRASLDHASRIVVLQEEALRELDPAHRRKARVVPQSAVPVHRGSRRRRNAFVVVALGHLRAVKDPLLAARAARLLPARSLVRIDHYGAPLDPRLARAARRESAGNPRWRWRGERTRAGARRALANADAFVQTSLAEGGSTAMSEAIVQGLPILATRIPGAVGMLGRGHPGLFRPGDARTLARLLVRCAEDPPFRRRLAAASERCAPYYAPAVERRAWRALLLELDDAPRRA
jgi:putative glycosyltransferase (TIGR04348 family)